VGEVDGETDGLRDGDTDGALEGESEAQAPQVAGHKNFRSGKVSPSKVVISSLIHWLSFGPKP
jgi:hypothetical protein